MSAIDTAPVQRPDGMPVAAIGHAVLWIAVFLGGFVFFEPAPYELFLALIIPAWLLVNPKLPRAIGPLMMLMVLFMAGGLLAAMQARDLDAQWIYYAVTGFLALSSCFYAAVLATNQRLYTVVINAWILAAMATTLLGVIGYFGLSGELFTKFDRAAGGFEDPNVFGPFLVFPFAVLFRRVLTRPLGGALLNGAVALWIFAGIFLSFSRAAWALALFAALATGTLLFLTERNGLKRARYLALATAGLVTLAVLVAVALSIPAVADLFEQRAQLVQDYDAEHLGRFQRHAIGFNMMLDEPLGIGAHELGKLLGEDEHNIWLKALTTYGWLGFAAYLALVVWTLAGASPLLFRSGPLQAVAQVAFVVLLGHIAIATVIDIDHWRHVYLLFGLLWGAIAADRIAAHARLAALHQGVSPRPRLLTAPAG